ncbi:MAG: site-specific integrase [Clostridia bacterium]|nr:site-specific integrase [Clostridia bacterium]
MTVEQLMQEFFRSYVKKLLKTNTIRGYRVNIENHIVPFMGNVELSDITYGLLDDFCGHMSDKGVKNTTTVYALSVLRKALNFAMKRGYIDRNIFHTYDMPRKEDYEYITLDAEQCRKFLAYLYKRDDDAFLPIYFALRHGLRRGECMGVKCSDIDRNRNELRISRSIVFDGKNTSISNCKTKSSRRALLLDDLDYFWIEQYSRSRPNNDKGYLCRDHDGNLLSTNVVQHHFVKALAACDLPRMRFHDLRHSYATHMINTDINPKLLSATLGHSDVKTTLSIYQHSNTAMQASINERTRDFLPDLDQMQD